MYKATNEYTAYLQRTTLVYHLGFTADAFAPNRIFKHCPKANCTFTFTYIQTWYKEEANKPAPQAAMSIGADTKLDTRLVNVIKSVKLQNGNKSTLQQQALITYTYTHVFLVVNKLS